MHPNPKLVEYWLHFCIIGLNWSSLYTSWSCWSLPLECKKLLVLWCDIFTNFVANIGCWKGTCLLGPYVFLCQVLIAWPKHMWKKIKPCVLNLNFVWWLWCQCPSKCAKSKPCHSLSYAYNVVQYIWLDQKWISWFFLNV
jgi:hypothetical protein